MELPVELRGLCFDRARLMRKLAPVLFKAGYSNPQRNKINRARSKKRKDIRRAIQANSEAIAAFCMQYYTEEKIREIFIIANQETYGERRQRTDRRSKTDVLADALLPPEAERRFKHNQDVIAGTTLLTRFKTGEGQISPPKAK